MGKHEIQNKTGGTKFEDKRVKGKTRFPETGDRPERVITKEFSVLNEAQKSNLLFTTFRRLSGKAPESTEVDTIKYGKNKMIMKGSGEYRKHEEEIVLWWPEGSKSGNFKLQQNIEKNVDGEDVISEKANDPTWKQIIRKIGEEGEYPEAIHLKVESTWLGENGILEKNPPLEGSILFVRVKKFLVEQARKNYPEYAGKAVDLLTIGYDLRDRER